MPDVFVGPRAVPDVTGLEPEQAEAAIANAGLLVLFGSPRVSAEVAVGLIAEQSPAAGEEAEAGALVTLYAAVAAATGTDVVVPYLIGKTRAAAESRITDARLVASVSGSSGSVTAQDPAAFSVVSRGTTVSLTLGGAIIAAPNERRRGLPPYGIQEGLR